jgi:hypothetical protein
VDGWIDGWMDRVGRRSNRGDGPTAPSTTHTRPSFDSAPTHIPPNPKTPPPSHSPHRAAARCSGSGWRSSRRGRRRHTWCPESPTRPPPPTAPRAASRRCTRGGSRCSLYIVWGVGGRVVRRVVGLDGLGSSRAVGRTSSLAHLRTHPSARPSPIIHHNIHTHNPPPRTYIHPLAL